MTKKLVFSALILVWALSLSACFFSVGPSPEQQSKKPPVRGMGLGPNYDTKIWADGDSRGGQEPFAIKTDTYAKLAAEVNPAVVNIFTSQKIEAGIGIGLFSVPLPSEDFRAYSLGTGFLISEDGFLLTNYHVIKHADEIFVFLHDTNDVQQIKVIGVDPVMDLALLKINTSVKLPYLPLADSDKVRIGDPVVAVGNPYGLAFSMTTGVISAKNRTLSPGTRQGNFEQFIQTSALINPGNSGGPLINLFGEVVAINTAIIAKAQGLGFAVPSNVAKELIPHLVRSGKVDRGYFGVAVVDLTPIMAQQFKINSTQGILIARIDPEGPAAKAGLKKGDIIISVDGEKMTNAIETARKISYFPPGKNVPVTALRGGMELAFTVLSESFAD